MQPKAMQILPAATVSHEELCDVVVGLPIFLLKPYLNVGNESVRPPTLHRFVLPGLPEIIRLYPCRIPVLCIPFMVQHIHGSTTDTASSDVVARAL